MKTIPLTKGQFALVDDADFERVNRFCWFAVKRKNTFYACRDFPDEKTGKPMRIYMHRFILPGVKEINHQDGNGCNNQQDNIRPCSHLENMQGFQTKRAGTTSRFRGVYWQKGTERWRARVKLDGRMIHLGYFTDETKAALAYDAAATKYFKFASPNFPI